jgi:tetratricopeptide (TPR) repeat protein
VSISVRERRLALEKFAAGDRQILTEGLLDLSIALDLSFCERMTLVELAVEIAALDKARDFIDAARLDAPLSINEMVALADKYLDIGTEDSADELLNELISLPQAILAATEDTHELIEAARLFVKMERKTDAVLLLTTLLDLGHACSDETPDILRVLAAVATPADLRVVLGRCELALAQEVDDPDLYYAGAHLQLWSCLDELSAGADKTLLQKIFLNEKVYLGSRLEACALLARIDTRSTLEARAAARRLFERAVVSNLSEALAHTAAFEQCGLGSEVSALIERSIGDAALDPAALRNLADILQRRGENGRAEDCLKRARALDPKEPIYFPRKQTIESVEGQEQYLGLLRERFCDEAEELYERLEYARDLVEGNGDQQAWRFLIDTLRNPAADTGTRLRAAELLDELDLRDLPREAANELRHDPLIDDYWIGDFLLRIGRKRDAAVSFERAIKTCPRDYAHQIAARLADLRANSLLFQLETAE